MKFQQARYRTKGRKSFDLVVLHTMEWAERPTTAEACAGMFARDDSPKGSAHYCVDSDSVVQCVDELDTAWGAKGGDVNARAIHIEMAGFARQTAAEWDDDYSRRMLERVASLVADICTRRSIPVAFVTHEVMPLGARGITTHLAVTKAYKVSGGHTDPGVGFPMVDFVRKVDSYQAYPEEST
jgi:N-acetyl-anhydromuramyl-L-alanine amidase AmpD